MHTNFEIERVSLVGGKSETPSSQKFSKKALFSTLAAVSAVVVFVAVFSGSSDGSSWISDKTPNVLIALPALNALADVKLKNSSTLAQVNQIKYRADSISSLPEDSKYFSNIAPVMEKLIELQNSESLSQDDKKIASKLVEMVKNYKKSRMVGTAFDLNIATQSEKDSMLNQVKSWLRNEYKSVNKDLDAQDSELNKQIELFDDIKQSLVTLADKIPTKLCSELPWYHRWWNTVKGWFGSKGDCLDDKSNLLDLSSEEIQTLCSKLEWYKRWWNTIKGWFGSKPTNCKADILLADAKSKAEIKTLCKDLAWYERAWSSTKSFFGGDADCKDKMFANIDLQSAPPADDSANPTVDDSNSAPADPPANDSNSAPAPDAAPSAPADAKKALPLCKDVPWYSSWWSSTKSFFGGSASCADNILLETPVQTLCKDLEWYKRWWNTIKGWFGSKPTNCTGDVLLADTKAEVLKLCKDLEWYKRWWNTIKGWFGSKPTNCAESILLKSGKAKAEIKRLCKDLAWWEKAWSSTKSFFGADADCKDKLYAPITLVDEPTPLKVGELVKFNPLVGGTELFDMKSLFGSVAKVMGNKGSGNKPTSPFDMKSPFGSVPKQRGDKGSGNMPTLPSDMKSPFGSVPKQWGDKGSGNKKTELFDMKSLFGSVAKIMGDKGSGNKKFFNPMTVLASVASNIGKMQNLGTQKNLDISLPACDSVEFMQKWSIELTDTTCLDRESGLYYDLALQAGSDDSTSADDGSAPSDDGSVSADDGSAPADGGSVSADGGSAPADAKPAAAPAAKPAAAPAVKSEVKKVKTVLCKDTPWYSQAWNTVQGWFGVKGNCQESPAQMVITSVNENDAVLQTVLASGAPDNIKVIVPNTVQFQSSDLEGQELAKMPNYEMLFNVADSYIKPDTTESITLAGLEQYPVSEKSETWFNKFAEVFRNKGLPMELYEAPVASDLLDKIPSFVDTKPANVAVKFLDEFAKARSVILAYDKLDRAFLDHIERYLMTWAVNNNKQEFAEALNENMRNWEDLALNM
jgi:hypothetical protein